MQISFQTAETGGRTLLLVTSPVDAADQETAAQRLLSLRELSAGAVAFLLPPTQDAAVRVEQVGGEVGAEALLCAAMWFAVRRGLRKERRFLIETPQGVRTVHANPLTGVVSAQVSERKTAYSTVRQTVALGPAYDLSF